MGSRTELRLFAIFGLAILGTGLVVWGSATGRLTIFGDSLSKTNNATPITVSPRTTGSEPIGFTETFDSETNEDKGRTTALWDTAAGNVTLPPGTTTALVQSLTIANLAGKSVSVTLEVVADQPLGSRIDYAISPNGGVSWEPIFPGRKVTLTSPVGDWRWRALLSRGTASTSPNLSELTLTFVPGN